MEFQINNSGINSQNKFLDQMFPPSGSPNHIQRTFSKYKINGALTFAKNGSIEHVPLESNGKITLLDVQLTRKNNKFETTVY